MNAPDKPKPDDEFRMGASEFDEAMRKAFGAPPPDPKRNLIHTKVTKDQPKRIKEK